MRDVKVSICCQTYNHQDYIAQCLEGFVKQKTNFKFEILVHEDASTDKTASIIKQYEKKYPKLFRCVYQIENQYNIQNSLTNILFKMAKGEYIAICEGDDYWTDENKLQKQVDFLEANPSFFLTGHNIKAYYHENNEFVNWPSKEGVFDFNGFINGRGIQTLSIVFRNIVEQIPYEEYHKYPAPDFYLKAYLLSLGKGYVFPGYMGVYRIHKGGVWSTQNNLKSHIRVIKGYRLFLNSFKDRKQEIIKATLKYKRKHKMLFKDFSLFAFYDWIEFFRLGIKKIVKV